MKPMPLQEWANSHEPSPTLIFKDGYWAQIMFVRDEITRTLVSDVAGYKRIRDSLQVISTHTSKSVLLPVYHFVWDSIIFTLRHNFYNWKVSVDSPEAIDVDFMKLFDPTDERNIAHCYCEGFPPERVFDPYAKNKRQFTVELDYRYEIFTFLWILGNFLKKKDAKKGGQ